MRLPLEERKKTLAAFKDFGVEFGPVFQSAVTVAAAKSASYDTWLDIVFPEQKRGEEQEAWDPMQPKLCACKFSGSDRYRILMRSIIHERMIPTLTRGQAGLSDLRALTTALGELICKATSVDLSDVVAESSIDEIKDLHLFVSALQGDIEAKPDTFDIVMVATEGSKALVKQCVRQTPYWRNKEKDMRQLHVAKMTVLPEVQAAIASLGDGSPDWSGIAKQYPQWLDTLPSALTTCIEEAVKVALTSRLEKVSAKGIAAEEVQRFRDIVQMFLKAMPPSQRTRGFFENCADAARNAQEQSVEAEAKQHAKGWMQRLCKEPPFHDSLRTHRPWPLGIIVRFGGRLLCSRPRSSCHKFLAALPPGP